MNTIYVVHYVGEKAQILMQSKNGCDLGIVYPCLNFYHLIVVSVARIADDVIAIMDTNASGAI